MTGESERLWASRPAPHRVLLQALRLVAKGRVLIAVGIAIVCYGLGLANGVWLGSYRGRVADENYWDLRKSHAALVDFIQKHFPKASLTTGWQAAVFMDNKEKERKREP